jgi:hypothetical protein
MICPHCKVTVNIYRYRQRLKVFHCNSCNNDFSPFKDTIFEKSTTDLRSGFTRSTCSLTPEKGFRLYSCSVRSARLTRRRGVCIIRFASLCRMGS